MLVEGTLRWRVTEDAPLDLLVGLCLRDLAGLGDAGDPALPEVVPGVSRRSVPSGMLSTRSGTATRRSAVPRAACADAGFGEPDALAEEWTRWWRRAVVQANAVASWSTSFVPPHFAAFDRELALQDLVIDRFDEALEWAIARREEYLADDDAHRADYSADIVDVVRSREHDLRRQAGSFRLDIEVLPLAVPGAWVVGPDTVVVSWSLRDDHEAFRSWFTPIVEALV
ncbi:hypothetical protein [Humibacter albus]|jgi:hypothetical protein|uniref:hypothetical protein n=1 Tax=Humibacter albus TaxID=427754 RepID=UPI0003B40BE8|nr:hypothetical protein [Humibacter albus]